MSKKQTPNAIWRAALKNPPPKRKQTEAEKEARRLAVIAKRDAFFAKLKLAGLPIPKHEYLFAKEIGRKELFRADYAWPNHKVALEVDGGVWTQGRHTRGSGYVKDIEKRNLYALAGYRLIVCVPTTLCSKETIQLIKDVLK